jgi:formylglycine-generating enzyme required for sulfatase activity
MLCPNCSRPHLPGVMSCDHCGHQLPVSSMAATGARQTGADTGPSPSSGGHDPLLGRVLGGQYKVVEMLGQGGMGVVYRAESNVGDVVVKTLRVDAGVGSQARMRIRSEAVAQCKVAHTNVVQFRALYEDGADLFLIMEYVRGPSLEQVIQDHAQSATPIGLGEALRIFREVVSGVDAAHRKGVIHRDIKPSNVLIDDESGGTAKVTDFGIAKNEQDAIVGKGITQGPIGSPLYMAPEQIVAGSVDKRADVYALGILLFEMLTARPPFDGDSQYAISTQHLQAPFPSVRTYRPEVPAVIDEVLARACAKKPEDRFAGCTELLEALRGIEAPAGEAPVRGARPGGTLIGGDTPLSLAATSMAGFAGGRTTNSPVAGAVGRDSAGPTSDAALSTSGQQSSISIPKPPPTRPAAKASRLPLVLGVGGVVVVLGGLAAFVGKGTSKLADAPASGSAAVGAPPGASALAAMLAASASAAAAASAVPTGQAGNGDPDGMVLIAPPGAAGFFLDAHEVTLAEWQECVVRKGCGAVPTVATSTKYSTFCTGASLAEKDASKRRLDHPINCVTFEEAEGYCATLHKRLPTELEWEAAVKLGGGGAFPWGDAPPSDKTANLCDASCAANLKTLNVNTKIKPLVAASDGTPATAPARSFLPNGLAMYGLGGNVSEWVVPDPARKPGAAGARLSHGGSWASVEAQDVRTDSRTWDEPLDYRGAEIGFRCAMSKHPAAQ